MSERISKMDVRDMAMVRRVILGVIDDGPKFRPIWHFYEDEVTSENDANQDRLEFCDAVQSAILQEIGPDEVQLKAAMIATEHLAPVDA